MHQSFKRFIACLFIVLFVVGSFHPVSAEAAMKKPGNARFQKWLGKDFSSAVVAWNKVTDADCYEVKCVWTNGTHDACSECRYVDHYFNSVRIDNLNCQHVYLFQVRACKLNASDKVVSTSPWSNLVFITPWPKTVTAKRNGRSGINFRWNIIYGSNGYNIFLTTAPASKWYWSLSTPIVATATSATVKKYRGGNFKKYQNYYARVITRRKRNGVFCTVPEPSKTFYQVKF